MKTQCTLIIVMCLFVLNCGMPEGFPDETDCPGAWSGKDAVLNCAVQGSPLAGEDYLGMWMGENIVFNFGGFILIYDVIVILTETHYKIKLYTFPDIETLHVGSSRGTHEGLRESVLKDVWNTLTLTHAWDEDEGWQPIEGDKDYAVFWIKGSSMHFKYDIDDDHGHINAEGELIKQLLF